MKKIAGMLIIFCTCTSISFAQPKLPELYIGKFLGFSGGLLTEDKFMEIDDFIPEIWVVSTESTFTFRGLPASLSKNAITIKSLQPIVRHIYIDGYYGYKITINGRSDSFHFCYIGKNDEGDEIFFLEYLNKLNKITVIKLVKLEPDYGI